MIYEYDNLQYKIENNEIVIIGFLKNNISILSIPEFIDGMHVRKIAYKAFSGCSTFSCKFVEKFILPKGLQIIESNAFSGCSSMKEITIPDTVINIGERSFCNCTNLKKIYISNSIISIASNTFENCLEIEGIYMTELESAATQFIYIPKDENGPYEDYVEICNHFFSWNKYDLIFLRNSPLSGKIKVALHRLLNPIDLDEDAKKRYSAFLLSNYEYFLNHYVETNNLEMIIPFGKLNLIKEENINNYIEKALRSDSKSVLLYLIAYRHKKFNYEGEI